MTADGGADIKDRDLLDVLKASEDLIANKFRVLKTVGVGDISQAVVALAADSVLLHLIDQSGQNLLLGADLGDDL